MNADENAIAQYLREVKAAVAKDKFRIAINARRGANRKLFEDYIIDENRAKQILLDLEITDFSELRRNEHEGYEDELLYIFGKDVRLLERYGSRYKKVALYIKLNKMENCFVIVVSFHEQRFPVKYRFK